MFTWPNGRQLRVAKHRADICARRMADIEISITCIEILNCTFDPNPLYQRYIQVVVRDLRNQPWSFVPWSLARTS